MTERIYYSDPACHTFDAVVTKTSQHEGRPAAVLDRTCFYPTSGGQPFDTGRLGDATVIDVIDDGDEVVHVLTSALAEGAPVHGVIDWPRRFDHMQQHTGQHVLSAAFDRLFDNRTTSFHMGADLSTIDLAKAASPFEIERAVDEANRVVWEDLPVAIRFVSEDEARRLPLRKEPARGGTLRLIDVPDFDLSACGGTHVARTGAIGMIAVTAAERFRGGSRVTFACGGRALQALRGFRDAVTGSIRLLSVLPHELPAAIERAQAEGRDLRKRISGLQETLAGHEAARLVAAAPMADEYRMVIEVLDGWEAAGLKSLALALVAHGRVVVGLVSAATPAFVVVARSAGCGADANAVLRQLMERFGGRGGGKPDMAQGGGLIGAPAEIAIALREALDAAIR